MENSKKFRVIEEKELRNIDGGGISPKTLFKIGKALYNAYSAIEVLGPITSTTGRDAAYRRIKYK